MDEEREPRSSGAYYQVKAAGFLDLSVGDQKEEDWYCLLRKVQGVASLVRIKDGGLEHLIESSMLKWLPFFYEQHTDVSGS